MKVKDIIASALTLLGRADLVSALSDITEADREGQELIGTLVFCFNAVEDELAQSYIPLTAREELRSPNARFYYTSFAHNPVKIKSVTAGGAAVSYEVFPQYLAVDAREITVEYGYAPSRKKLDGESDYGDEVGEYLIALGIASEYSVINGEAEMATLWERMYRARLDGVQRKLPACASIPPRRWV